MQHESRWRLQSAYEPLLALDSVTAWPTANSSLIRHAFYDKVAVKQLARHGETLTLPTIVGRPTNAV